MTPRIACSKYARFCDLKPIRYASPFNGRWIDALIVMTEWVSMRQYIDATMHRALVGDAVQIYRVYYHWYRGVTVLRLGWVIWK